LGVAESGRGRGLQASEAMIQQPTLPSVVDLAAAIKAFPLPMRKAAAGGSGTPLTDLKCTSPMFGNAVEDTEVVVTDCAVYLTSEVLLKYLKKSAKHTKKSLAFV